MESKETTKGAMKPSPETWEWIRRAQVYLQPRVTEKTKNGQTLKWICQRCRASFIGRRDIFVGTEAVTICEYSGGYLPIERKHPKFGYWYTTVARCGCEVGHLRSHSLPLYDSLPGTTKDDDIDSLGRSRYGRLGMTHERAQDILEKLSRTKEADHAMA